MFKCNIKFLVILIVITTGNNANAFDPVTISTGLQAASNVMDGINKVDEAADVGFALSGLLEELGIDSETDESLELAIKNMNEANSKARDLKWSKEELDSNFGDMENSGRSLSRRIKSLKNSIQMSKKIASIMQIRPKAAERAVSIQEINLNSMMLEELQSLRKAQYMAYLESNRARIKREIFIEEIKLNSKKQGRVL